MAPAFRTTHRLLVTVCVILAMFMAAIEVTIVATAMPAIVGQLGNFSLYTWVFSAFLLTQAATIMMFGRPVLIAGISVFLARVGAVRARPLDDDAHHLSTDPGAGRRLHPAGGDDDHRRPLHAR